tara:strand:- start:748 stop:1134 length:387 start_codon:yes stop_codon:yes gene_type:complete
MKYIFLFLLIFTNFEIMAKKISELNWQKRLLIVSYENKEDELLIQTKKFIISNDCKINDRKLDIIYFEKFLNEKFETPKFIESKKGIWLIGYDGGIKDFSSDDKILLRLFEVIDSMPMRKQEMISDKC